VTGESSMKISDSIVANNTATKLGGAFRVDDQSSFEAFNTTFICTYLVLITPFELLCFIVNEGKQGGCGRVERSSSAKASKCEFFAHTSTKEGGLMMVSGSSLALIDSSIRSTHPLKFRSPVLCCRQHFWKQWRCSSSFLLNSSSKQLLFRVQRC